jgi:SPP1 gp7 family putative phage head morphogenesis protein
MKSIESAFNVNFLQYYYPGIECHFDIKAIPELNDQLNEKIDVMTKLLSAGVPLYDINEKLELGFELDAMPWTRTWWKPFSLSPVDMSEDTNEEPIVEDDTVKRIKTLQSLLSSPAVPCACTNAPHKVKADDGTPRYQRWKALIDGVAPIEKRFLGKLERWIYGIRKEVLAEFNGTQRGIKQDIDSHFNEEAHYKELKKIATPIMEEALRVGGDNVFMELGLEGSFDMRSERAIRALDEMVNKMKAIPDTISQGIRDVLRDGVTSGATTEQIAANLRNEFNIIKNRAQTIAQTEINTAANTGKIISYGDAGIEKITWVNSYDDRVRESHMIDETVKVGERFSNGLLYPGDRSVDMPEETINCRCTTEAVLE